MQFNDLLEHYSYLSRLACSKLSSQDDADDLVSDTYLAALAFIRRGGVIAYPKTWLANTLMHKHSEALRRKYKSPVVINLDMLSDLADEDDTEFYSSDEAAVVRRELLYMAHTNREVLIRYYFNGQSIGVIAAALRIPNGTVKSRLSSGREQIKKGLSHMDNQTNYLPGRLNISYSGSGGADDRPNSLIEGDLIAQNLLILAYEKPQNIIELAKMIAIPTVYIEPILDKLTDGELMVKTESGKYYTDFIIYKPEDGLSRFEGQLAFVRERFDIFWSVMSEIIKKLSALGYYGTLNPRQRKKLERYTIMCALQDFINNGVGDIYKIDYTCPARRYGGHWKAMGWSSPAGYDYTKVNETFEYTVVGGLRTSEYSSQSVKYLQLREFDTTLWDNPRRFTVCGSDTYFKQIHNLLWCVYNDIPLESAGISNTMIEKIPGFEKVGMLSRESGKLTVDIPVMDEATHTLVTKIADSGCDKLISEIGSDYQNYLRGAQIRIPSHLKSVSEWMLYGPAKRFIEMAAIREAYDRGLHMHDVDYCCPPVVLVYRK